MENDWQPIPLCEVLTERQEKPLPLDFESGAIRIVSKIGFNDGKIQLRNGGDTRTGMILIRPGDLVVSGINAIKGAVAVYDERATAPIAATIHYAAYLPNRERVDIRFLWWLLRSETFREILLQSLPGGIKSELKPKRFLSVPVPLPSLSGQQRIVARIEALARRVEEVCGLRSAAVEEAGAVMGAALAQVFGIETEAVLRFGDEHNARIIAGLHIMAGECNQDGIGIPYMTGPADFGLRTPTPTRWAEKYKSTCLPGDVLVTVKGAGVGKTNIAPDYETAIGRQIMAIRPQSNLLTEYIYYFVRHSFQGIKESATATTVPGVKKEDIENLQAPNNNLVDQRRIVAYLDGLQAKVDALRRLQAETQKELDALMPSILAKAFAGEL